MTVQNTEYLKDIKFGNSHDLLMEYMTERVRLSTLAGMGNFLRFDESVPLARREWYKEDWPNHMDDMDEEIRKFVDENCRIPERDGKILINELGMDVYKLRK